MAQMVKIRPARWETRVWSLGWEDPWRRKWQPTLVLLPGKSHGWWSLAGYSPKGRKELDITEQLHSQSISKIFIVCNIKSTTLIHWHLHPLKKAQTEKSTINWRFPYPLPIMDRTIRQDWQINRRFHQHCILTRHDRCWVSCPTTAEYTFFSCAHEEL